MLVIAVVLMRWLLQARARIRRYRAVNNQLIDCILLADSDSGQIIEANPAAGRALGVPDRELVGRNLRDLSAALAPERLRRLRAHWAAQGRVLRMRGHDGRRIPLHTTLSWIRLGRQELICVVGRNLTALRALAAERRAQWPALVRRSHCDLLTGLPNRAYLEAKLPRIVGAAGREESLIALLYVDLDHFKDVNDSLGHRCGDRLLRAVARRLRGCLSSEDLVVRMGGDEFIVVAVGLPSASTVDYIAGRIQETLSAPIEIDGTRLNVLASIGISICPTDGTTLDELLKHADLALARAKARGRGHHQFFTSELKEQLAQRLELEHALRRALGTDQLFIEYQPSFDLATRWPAGFEALLRWRHPELGLVSPVRFVPIAEQSNLILELGAWVLRQVCRQLAQWRQEGFKILPVSINLTPRQYEHGRLPELIAGLAREFGIEASWLQFEITESAAMQNSAGFLPTLQALRRLGSRILVDDFGTGYSSLSYLKNLPVDALKIDKAFVHDMTTNAHDAAIVSAVMGIARSLQLTVVAEGVETAEQVDSLAKLGCDAAQGFYFSRPLAPPEAGMLLESLGEGEGVGIPLAGASR